MNLLNSYYLKFAKNIFSQNGEDGIIKQIFDDLNITDGILVEFGAWDGIYLSNIFNLWKDGKYQAILIESSREKCDELFSIKQKFKNIEVYNRFVNPSTEHPDSIDNILSESLFDINEDNFQLMSIDIDSCDYSVFESIKKYFPKIIVIETNTNYDVNTEYFSDTGGCSLRSACILAERKGYTLVCHTGNAFFIRNDLMNKIPKKDFSIENLFVSTDDVSVLQTIDFNGNKTDQIFYFTNYYHNFISQTKNNL